VGRAERTEALGGTRHRAHRAQARRYTTKYPQTRWSFAPPIQTAMED
jgi:hypothetical protein